MPTHAGPHKYVKATFKQSGTEIFRCMLLGCPHFVYEPMIVGRPSICNRCNCQYVITVKSIRAKKMHCEDCCRGRYNKVKEKEFIPSAVDSKIDNLLVEIEREKSEKLQ